MNRTFVITPHVINTINSLPTEERLAIVSALAGEMILGVQSLTELSPMQEIIYSIIKMYVRRDTERLTATSEPTFRLSTSTAV